ncbi:MMPL family transporter [Leucobacter chromiireducens]|uniref:MMPL family transporter n=1 Tax=Leucobacter chromiireducens TaxID=283877 RepID=UPI000F63CFF2|nr:MMPL family transporter [Leucobacter chromiireducens]
MSTLLYAIGRWAIRARKLVLILWIALLALLGVGAALFSQGANAPITIPGTESQAAIDTLGRTFPEVSGTSATIIVVAPEGQSVEDSPIKDEIVAVADELAELPKVNAVSYPFAELGASGLSDDGRAALLTIQIDATQSDAPAETSDGIAAASDELRDALPAGSEVSYGGDLFSVAIPGFTVTEALGVAIAFIVLLFTLGSLVAAGMPLLIAILGVGVTIAGLFVTTAFAEMTSTTPMLALMLGLAVGIDYTLFIVSRHQEQLRSGLGVEESIARATATSGSAVVFAGLTVIIALLGLAVAGIPFLTALGVAAAAGVAVAVLIGVTLTPAVLAMAGIKILPKKQRAALAAQAAGETLDSADNAAPARPAANGPSRADRFFGGWVRVAVAKPIITILVVLVGLGAAAIPALDLRLALPGAETLEQEDPARVTYELTGEHFGEGANGPLILTGSIITSTDPLGLMEDLADEVRALPGVADVPLATPNQNADTGIIQVVPEDGPQSVSTEELVAELRAHHDEWEEKYGVSLAVTGFTAVGIDVSHLLGQALLPFGVLVVGLSLILLAMVFRSVWVPIKATLGYLLSVGAAFGAVVAVFQWGWLGDLLNVHHAGPVLSFMPIILMGVLFGLAMDYEVFLVARIREEYVHGADAQTAIQRGFVGSAKVVTAAALIMFAVFAAFVPEGDPSIKVIALGLAVGVFVDAFVVRMTLVPAVLALLGDRAWQMPRWLAKVLPSFDVEGEGLARELAHADWPSDRPGAVIATERAQVGAVGAIPDLRLDAGDVLLLDPRDPVSVPLASALVGRAPVVRGTAKVAGLLLPERAGSLRARSGWATPDSLRDALTDRPALLLLDLRSAADGPIPLETVDAMRSGLAARAAEASHDQIAELVLVVLGEREIAERVLPAGARILRPADAAPDPAPAPDPAAHHAHAPAAPAHAPTTPILEGGAR